MLTLTCFSWYLPQLRSPHDQSTDRKLLSADSIFQCGLKSAKKKILSTQLGISAAVEDVDDVKTFTLRANELIDCLYKRGYNRYFLQREIQRVNNITRTETVTPHDTSTLDKIGRVPFVITYNPSLRSISSIIHKHFHFLISFPRCYNVFKAAPIIALDVVVTSAIF